MKTITLTDEQFDTLFEYVDDKVTTIVDASVDYQDSEILEEWEDLFDVHTVLESTKQEYEDKLFHNYHSAFGCFALAACNFLSCSTFIFSNISCTSNKSSKSSNNSLS